MQLIRRLEMINVTQNLVKKIPKRLGNIKIQYYNWLILVVSIILLITVIFQNYDNQGYHGIKSKTPEWITINQFQPYEEKDKIYHFDGAVILLSDIQENFNEKASYYRGVKKVISLDGVDEHSIFSHEYDPYFSKIYLNKVLIFRGNEKIDVTKDVIVKIRSKKMESESFFSDYKRVNFVIPGVKKGDIIDYSILKYANNKISKANSTFLDLKQFIYTKTVYRSVIAKDEENGSSIYKVFNDETKPIINILPDGNKKYVFHKSNSPIYDKSFFESDVPEEIIKLSKVQFSDQKDYSLIVDDYKELYKTPYFLNGSLKLFIKGIKNNNQLTIEEKINKFIRFVQNDIRYLLIAGNISNFKPDNPNDVFDNLASDCKGKTMLLITLLKEIGITAHPALVSSQNKKAINEFLPAADIFDHVIVNIEFEGKNYFVDATRKYQAGSFKNSFISDFGYGLILKEGENNLTQIPSDKSFQQTATITFDLVSKKDVLVFTIDEVLFLEEAERYRKYLDETDRKLIEAQRLAYYQQYFKNAKLLSNLAIIDNKPSNTIFIHESYSTPLSDIFDGKNYQIPMFDFKNKIHEFNWNDKNRFYPYKLRHKNFIVKYDIFGEEGEFETIKSSDTDNILFSQKTIFNKDFVSSVIFEYSTINHILHKDQLQKQKSNISKLLPKNIIVPKTQANILRNKYVRKIKSSEKELVKKLKGNKNFCPLSKEERKHQRVDELVKTGSQFYLFKHCKQGYYLFLTLPSEIYNYQLVDEEFFPQTPKGNNCEYYHEVPLVICQKNIGKSDESYLEIKSKKNNTFFLFHVFLLNNMTNSDDLNSIINDFNGSKNRYIR